MGGAVWTVRVLAEYATEVQTARQRTAWPCGDATYLHSGRAAAMCLAPSDPRLLSLTSKVVIALMVLVLVNNMTDTSRTYGHLGRNAAAIIAPESPRPLLLRLASVMSAFMVKACWSPKVMVSINLNVAKAISASKGGAKYFSTYLHSGIAAAKCLASSTPSLLSLIFKETIPPLHSINKQL